MKIVITDGFLVNHDNLGLSLEEHELVWYPASAPEEVARRIGDADGVIVNGCRITREVIDACPNLKYIGILATGYNIVDLEAARERGITVCNAPGYSTRAVAQHTLGLLLEIAGRTGRFDRFVREGGWAKGNGHAIAAVSTVELEGKIMGIYGAGEIGRAVARLAEALGMRVLAYRRSSIPGDGLHYVPEDELLSRSDVVSLHTPLTDATRGLFGKETIAKMKDGAILLNTARGALVDESAVAAALDRGKLYAYGADVLCEEPPQPGNPLVGHPRVVITPHVAWHPRETRARLLEIAAQNVRAFVAGHPQNVVNP